jgi:hypothetical protein
MDRQMCGPCLPEVSAVRLPGEFHSIAHREALMTGVVYRAGSASPPEKGQSALLRSCMINQLINQYSRYGVVYFAANFDHKPDLQGQLVLSYGFCLH